MKVITHTTIIPSELSGSRIDQALARLFPDYSRATLQRWITAQQVTMDHQFISPKTKVNGGEHIAIAAQCVEQNTWQAEAIQLDIIYEDSDLLVLNKPVGLVTHPAAGNWQGTLVNALLHHAPSLAELPRAGLVHRLDKDTSGLLVVAKTLPAHFSLIKQLQARTMQREYHAIVSGCIIAGSTIDAPIGRHPNQRTRMAVTAQGKKAITHYRVSERFRAHTLLQVQLATGRTHQIRVHLASINHPLIGDSTYGWRLRLPRNAQSALVTCLQNYKHQALHAACLGLVHPSSGETLQWHAPPPSDFQQLLTALREDTKHDAASH